MKVCVCERERVCVQYLYTCTTFICHCQILLVIGFDVAKTGDARIGFVGRNR